LPLVLVLLYGFLRSRNQTEIKIRQLIINVLPFFIILSGYFLMRFLFYGFAVGESYIWDFSPRIFNTLFWYGLWAFNLPEMLVDFVGSGISFNPNLFRFWSREIIPVFLLFLSLVSGLAVFIWNARKEIVKNKSYLLFSLGWFSLGLVPVIFLPLHKFTFYLTLPLVGFSLGLSYLISISRMGNRHILLFLSVWLSLSILTLMLTTKTHWIVQGSKVASRVHDYLILQQETTGLRALAFYDSPQDEGLPWRPSELLKVVLSDQNYFKVFWNDKFVARYYNSENEIRESAAIKIRARTFLDY
jgi:hypothetical protein